MTGDMSLVVGAHVSRLPPPHPPRLKQLFDSRAVVWLLTEALGNEIDAIFIVVLGKLGVIRIVVEYFFEDFDLALARKWS